MDLLEEGFTGDRPAALSAKMMVNTTVPVRYSVDTGGGDDDDEQIADDNNHDGRNLSSRSMTNTTNGNSHEVEYILNDLNSYNYGSSTDDENGNIVKTTTTTKTTTGHRRHSETHTSQSHSKTGVFRQPPPPDLLKNAKHYNNNDPSISVVTTLGNSPRYQVPTPGNLSSNFRLSIPAIPEVKESGSDTGGGGNESSTPPSTPPTMNKALNNLLVPNGNGLDDFTDHQHDCHQRPARRRFSIRLTSSSDESSSSQSDDDGQPVKIEHHGNVQSSRQRPGLVKRRSSLATTSTELAQAMTMLMGRRGSATTSDLLPLLTNALNLVNASKSAAESSNPPPRRKHRSTTSPPLIQVQGEDTTCTGIKNSGRSLSPSDILRKPHDDGNYESADELAKHFNTDIEVIRILTTRSPAVSENDDTDEEIQQQKQPLPQRRRRTKGDRKSSTAYKSLRLLETPAQPSRRSSTSVVPTQLQQHTNKPRPSLTKRRSSLGSSQSKISPLILLQNPHDPDNDRDSKTTIELSVTPPPADQTSPEIPSILGTPRISTRRGSACLPDAHQTSNNQRNSSLSIENLKKSPRRRSICIPAVQHHNDLQDSSRTSADQNGKETTSMLGAPPKNTTPRRSSVCIPDVRHDAADSQESTQSAGQDGLSVLGLPKNSSLRRASAACIPAAHHPAANPPVSSVEEEEIRFRATRGGRRRSSWACPGAVPPLVGLARAISPMTLLRETNYYGDELADNKKYQDPYHLTIHFITDPKKSRKLKKLLKPLIDSIAPKLKLFNYVERSEKMKRKISDGGVKPGDDKQTPTVPASGVVLFLNEGFGMERILEAQKYLSAKAEWSVHHSETVGANAVPYPTNNQDFYAHQDDMPLWAIRQVHFGRDRLRFQIFVSYDNWQDTIDFYSTVLARNFQYQKDDFCYFLVFASRNLNIEVQLAFKKLPLGFKPRLLDSTILQFKVENIGGLVPLLPNVCTPISDSRWQTVDPDGNKILLFNTLNGELTIHTGYSAPSSTTSTVSSDKSTEISDTETTGTPDPSPRSESPMLRLPQFVNSRHVAAAEYGDDDDYDEPQLVSAV